MGLPLKVQKLSGLNIECGSSNNYRYDRDQIYTQEKYNITFFRYRIVWKKNCQIFYVFKIQNVATAGLVYVKVL